MANRPVSKSTKRRRFLEEVEFVDNLYSLDQPPRTSVQIVNNEFECMQENSNSTNCLISNNKIEPINSSSLPIVSFFNSNSPLIDESELHLISDSDSDDDVLEQFHLFADDNKKMLNLLSQWAVGNNITNTALSALLKILKSHKCFDSFPLDARTILKTNLSNNNSNSIRSVPPGIYHHFGISNGLNSLRKVISYDCEEIKILIGIDGLPLTKSSSSTFWPIVGHVQHQSNYSCTFLIGVYWGKDKPKDSNIFLRDTVNELKELSKNGLITDFGRKRVVVSGFCCDAPARSFILKTKGHTGFFSCSRCTIEGIYLENRVCFPSEINFDKRTHSNFLNRSNDEYHITNSVSLITEIPHLDIICNFPLDYMHLVCLGVMKKLILLWMGSIKKAPLSVRLPTIKVLTISNNLLLLKPFITSDFSRPPRGLNEVPRWKATEYRLFLLYSGPIVLQGMLNEDCYSHFMCLHICFRILLTPNIDSELIHFCEKLLIYFVDKFGKLYGKHFISHNVHGLLHIVDDYVQYGALDNCSCFPFENFLQFLKKMVRKFEKPLEQVIKRYNEYLTFSEFKDSTSKQNIEFRKPHNEGPLIDKCTGPEFKCVIIDNFKIDTKSIANCYIGFVKDNQLNICKVENICKNDHESVLIVKFFGSVEPFFVKPINSIKLQIAIVKNLSNELVYINLNNTNFKKYMIFNNAQKLEIAYPILHTIKQ